METVTSIHTKLSSRSGLVSADLENPGFGNYMSDHMYMCRYSKGEWRQAQLLPYGDILLSPATLALHYGQSVFEGMKAFRMQDGRANIFRVDKHWQRLNASLERMCMPLIPETLFKEALHRLVELDRGWVPQASDTALYIRPFVFASEAKMGVKVSDEYVFMVITGPVSLIYPGPIKVKVERNYIRAAAGGTGYAKCCGNYGGSFYPTSKAREEGYDQVLWTDAAGHNYIEESGTMNVMFVIGDKLITPSLSDSILDGVTRDSLLVLAAEMGFTIEERRISVEELQFAFLNRTITEAFGAGTAAVVAPIATVGIDGRDHHLPAYTPANVMFKLKDRLDAIRSGRERDRHGWNYIV